MKYENFGRYLLRKPLFSNKILFENLKTKELEVLVNELIYNDEFTTSIYWSSPDLYNLILSYRNNHLNEGKKIKLINTLKKYAIRICTRPTPYGTMAGVVLKEIYPENKKDQNHYPCRKARIDMEFLNELKLKIENIPYVRKKLRYKINNTAFKIAGHYKYYEPTASDNEEYQSSSLEANEYIDKIFKLSELTHYVDIHNLFSNEFNNDEIFSFLDELINNKFLVSELQIKITTDNTTNFKGFLSRLDNSSPEVKFYIDIFDKIENCIKIIETTEISYLPKDNIIELKNIIKSLGLKSQHLFHVDLLHSSKSEADLNKNILTNINYILPVLQNFKRNNSFYNELEHFKQMFRVKYDSEEVSLLEVLDDEYGIGFPANGEIGNLSSSKLIEGKSKKEIKKKEVDFSYLEFLFEIIERNQDSVIELEKYDVKAINNTGVSSQNFCIMGTNFNDSFFIQSISNSNSILGRFALLDNKIEKLCQDITQKESDYNSNTIFAEVLYLPEKRIGNIARRPTLSEYEIPIFIDTSNNSKQIMLNDIFVSIKNNEITLRSKKHDKRVIPRLSNAHNFLKSDNSIYKFLCYLQFQNEDNIIPDIDYSHFKKPHIPRIIYKNIILHRATWIIYEKDINAIKKSLNPLAKLKSYIEKWRITQYVVLVQGDNELFIDTTNDSYLFLLVSEFKTKKIIQLSECLYESKTNHFFNEQIILPLYNNISSVITPLPQRSASHVQRSFIPGSEWIYLKVYCNSNISDKILSQEFNSILKSLILDGLVKSSFFIRYTDPHYHIRFRLHLLDKTLYSTVLQKIYENLDPYLQNKMVWNIQIDSYHRELERYDSEYMEDTQKAFFHDSLLVLKLLENENFIESENFRLFSAIKNVDHWLSLFNLSLQEKLEFCKTMEQYYSSEFSVDFKNHISSKYRELRNELDLFLENSIFKTYFLEREKYLSSLTLSRSKLSDYIHMSLNRWFNSEQRALELMTYAFAVKQYSKILSYSK